MIIEEQEPLPTLPSYELDFFANLVPMLNAAELDKLGGSLMQEVESDEASREKYIKVVEESLEVFSQNGGVVSDDEDDSDIDMVKHVLLEEAVIHAQGRALMQANPADGPIKFKIVAESDEQTRALQERAVKFMNYQLKHIVDDWSVTLDTMLNHLVLYGTTALKACWDPVFGRPDIEFVPIKNLIVSSDSTTLTNSKRYTHRYYITKNEYLANVDAGWFSNVEQLTAPMDEEKLDDIEGSEDEQDEFDPNKELLVFYEVYTSAELIDLDGNILDPYPMESSQSESPYVITIDSSTHKVVSVRRNWNPDSPKRKPIQSIQEFKFFPGLGFYGYGFYHKIGGLDKAATSALRANLKAAALSLNRPKVSSGGGLKGGRIKARTGLVMNIGRGSAEDVAKNIHELQVMPPDQTMLALSADMSEQARRLANTTDMQVGELGKANTPAATTLALIQKGEEALTTIHKRMHESLGKFFKMIQRLNHLYLDPKGVPFTVNGETQMIFGTDFDPRTIDIVPYSDPTIASDTQKIIQGEQIVQLALQRPDIIDLHAAYRDYLKALKHPNPEELLVANTPPPALNAVSENEAFMNGAPVQVYDHQDDVAHINVHMQFITDPTLMGNPMGQELLVNAIAHVRDHIGRYYRKKVSAAIGIPITGQPLPPEQEALITMRASQLIQASPMIQAIQSLQQNLGDPAMDSLIQQAQLDMQIKQMEAQQELQINEQKALADLRSQREKVAAEREVILIKAETEASAEQRNHALKVRNMELEFDRKQEIAVQEAREEEKRKWQDHIQELKMEWEKHLQEMQAEREEEVLKLEGMNAELEAKAEKLEADIEASKKKSMFSWGGDK